jgi:hypothetical protein
MEKNYETGGARGEVARKISGEAATMVATTSRGCITDTIAMTGDGVTTAAPTAEQTGQM